MDTIRLIGRSSRLSVLQMGKVKDKIKAVFPDLAVEMIAGSSRGDSLQDIPLQTVDGTDFFTQEIFEKLTTGEADIAVHSLKDMSAEHFFGGNVFAVVDRDDVRDVAIFHSSVKERIMNGESLVIGTCSPRREEMATGFLQKALPQLNPKFRVITKFIRGNVDTRLKKLDSGEYDGIILATTGLNRLLSSKVDSPAIKGLLASKLIMILPLVECPPAPCQGAIVAEANPGNEKAAKILEDIGQSELTDDCIKEKKIAVEYGRGCLQKFGVTTISYDNKRTIYAAGKSSDEQVFAKWYELPSISAKEKVVFNTSDLMGRFFDYEYFSFDRKIEQRVVFVSNYKAINPGTSSNNVIDQLKQKKVWVAGTKTWFELAKKGIWVEGCADALGLESLRSVLEMPLVDISTDDVCVLTNQESEQTWQQKGWCAIGTYGVSEKENEELKSFFAKADIIFWTSYRQYEQYKSVIKGTALHCCPAGETSALLRTGGINPVVFPTIKSFQQWRESSIPSRSAA